jgi:hypothetical protein
MDEHSGVKAQGFGKESATLGRFIMLAAEAAAQEAPTPDGGT